MIEALIVGGLFASFAGILWVCFAIHKENGKLKANLKDKGYELEQAKTMLNAKKPSSFDDARSINERMRIKDS